MLRSLRTSSIARWKARERLPIRYNRTFTLALTVEALQGKTCQNSLLLERVGQFEPIRGKGSSVGNRPIFWFLQN